MHNIGVVKAAGDRHRLQFVEGRRFDTHEQTIDRVVRDAITVDVRPNAIVICRELLDELERRRVEIGFLEAVRRGRHGPVRAVRNGVECDCRPGVDHVDWVNRPRLGIHRDFPAAVANICVIHVVQEDALSLQRETTFRAVNVVAEFDSAPVAKVGRGRHAGRPCVEPDRVVVVRGKNHRTGHRIAVRVDDQISGVIKHVRRAKHLQGAVAPIHRRRRTADTDPSGVQFDNSAGIDHHGDVLRHVQLDTIREARIQRGLTNLVSQVVVQRGQIAVGTAIADDAEDVAGLGIRQGVGQIVVRVSQRARARRRPESRRIVGLVHEDRLGHVRLGWASQRSRCLEPEVVDAAR